MIRAAVFDAYGTLFDVHSAVARHAARIGPPAGALSSLWRARQIEYAFVHTLMGVHRDFWTLTGAALDHALAVHGLEGDATLRADLMGAYRALDAYADVRPCLSALKDQGLALAILSNGTPDMLAAAVDAAGLTGWFDHVLSVETVGAFKTDPRVYGLATTRLGLAPEAIAFQSSNPWDAAGAAAFGFSVHWINRSGAPVEYDLARRARILRGLDDLPGAIGGPGIEGPRKGLD